MADKAISQLTQASSITATDLFVLQQSNEAKSLPGQVLINWLTAAADGHGGISSIAKTGTSGLVDTYTITYADTTTGTFTVTNGAKGDTGAAGATWYTHIKYSAVEPTQDSDMKSTADDWMGIYAGTSSTAPTTYTSYTWYKIKGTTGDTGKSITSVTYVSTSGLVDTYRVNFSDNTSTTFTVTNGSSIDSIEKTGTSGLTDTYTVTLTDGSTENFTVTNGKSITSITNVDVTHAAGHTDEYRINFNDGDTFTFYVYNGENGSGSVSTVDGISASNQNVTLLTFGSGAPTASTQGSVKSRYFDTANGQLYICTAIDTSGLETTYTWRGSSVTVDSVLSSQSTNPVQNAVLTAIIGTGSLETVAQNLIAAVNEVAADADEALTAFQGATALLDGTKGAVPKPFATYQNRRLAGDGTWRQSWTAVELEIPITGTGSWAQSQSWPSGSAPLGVTDLTCDLATLTVDSNNNALVCADGDDFKVSEYNQSLCPAPLWVYVYTNTIYVATLHDKTPSSAVTIRGLILHQ